MKFSSLALVVAIGLLAVNSKAALIVNSAQPITQVVNVQVITVADNAGANPAPVFGTTSERAAILAGIDAIWAQAGIDVNFSFRAATYNSTFASIGTVGNNNPRPTGDLNTILSNAGLAGGVLSPDPNTINMFMVQIVPGFSQTSNNTANGLALVGGNGITAWAGPALTSFTGGQEVISSVMAHEIGHNLGLSHIVEIENLMQAGGSPNQGERLNASQISTALASSLSVPVPEPTMAAGFALFGAMVMFRRHGRKAA